MDTETVTLFLALLAVVAQTAVVVLVVTGVGGRRIGVLARLHARIRREVGPSALALAATVAGVCTAGSLYLSEIAGYPPCRLCWYQRFAMYPLVPLLAVAAWRRSRRLAAAGAVLAATGATVSIWHMLVERNPDLESATTCDLANPCSTIWVEHLGYLTIPTMALSGFVLVIALVLVTRSTPAQEAP
jgi:disulfide bond formation protein DsbB